MSIKKILGYSVVALWLTAVLIGGAMFEVLNRPMPMSTEGYLLTVKPGDSLSGVANQLTREELLGWPKVLVTYAKITQQTDIKAGEYQLPENMTALDLLVELVAGRVVEYSVTIPEGLSYREVLTLLAQTDKLESLLSSRNLAEQQRLLAIEEPHLEGWFFPDTYKFVAGHSDVDILRRAHKKMQLVLEEEWQQRQLNLPYQNAYEALIMASIVEKETGVASERATIAGVFVKRLQKGMRLQTDPTVIYGLGENYQGNIKRSHLKDETPYNTYVIKGLPPTPIAMPGREAIRAALQPEDNNYLYFVAKGDGSHHFSTTFEEHKKAVARYQIFGRLNDYQSSPTKQTSEL